MKVEYCQYIVTKLVAILLARGPLWGAPAISKPILLRYISLAQQNLRYIADFVAILGIIARNMPMWQRDRNMAKKFVVLMIIIAISGSLPVKNLSKETVLATFPKPMKN